MMMMMFLFINVFTAWHRCISPMNFIIQQSRSFEGVCVPLRLTSCNSPAAVAPDTTPGTGRQSRYRAANAPKLTYNTVKQVDLVRMTWDLIEASASMYIPRSRTTRTGVIRSEPTRRGCCGS